MAVVWVLSSGPVPTPLPAGSDKLVHLVVYGALGALLRWGVGPTERNRRAFLGAFVVGTLYGILDEVHQASVVGRMPSVGDAFADAAGVAIGAWLGGRAPGAGGEDR